MFSLVLFKTCEYWYNWIKEKPHSMLGLINDYNYEIAIHIN